MLRQTGNAAISAQAPAITALFGSSGDRRRLGTPPRLREFSIVTG